MPVVATAGHVDHGKSTLVHALTGIDPDRWEAEKTRGLTIDLGFAWCALPDGTDIAFVDVPGHSRFISNMLAGVGGVDACMFVVDATEGWKPQSEEHLRILDVLGLHRGLVVVTKAALADDEALEIVRLDIAEHVAGTFLDGADVVTVDALTGAGLDELRDALARVIVAADAQQAASERPRLWVDRVFAARGAGTVVTGTLTRGSLRVHDQLVVEPAGTPVRVRGLQSHQRQVDDVGPGRRVAVNLAGTTHHDVGRGDALVRPQQWARASAIDCTLTVVPGLDHDVTRRGAFHAHIGSGEYSVRVRVLGGDAIAPGATGLARVHLPVALPLVPGDHYVLRESGRGETVGGGEVLDVNPVLPASRARPDRSIARVIEERGWIDVGELERLTGAHVAPTVGRWAASDAALADAEARLRAQLDAGGVDTARLDERDAAVLARLDGVATDHGRARWATAPTRDWSSHPYLAALNASPFTPPGPDGVDRAELRELLRAGLVVDCNGDYFSSAAISAAGDEVARLLQLHPDGVTVAVVRDALGTTRKHALPLLAHLDATGVTRRRGDLRVAGPYLPQAVE